MMKNKKLKLIIILALVIQIILPAGMLAYHYSIYNYALNNTPDFKFCLSYFDMYSYGENNEITYKDGESGKDVFYFDIANSPYRTDVAVTVDADGFAVMTGIENKRLNKHWFSYENYNKLESFNQTEGDFRYVETEEAEKIMKEWKIRYFDIYEEDVIIHKGGNAVYITAKVYKGIFIPMAVYKDNVKIIEFIHNK